MRELVRDDQRDPFLLVPGGGPRVHQQGGLAEQDEAAVLHGARGEARHGYLIVLVVMIGHAEIVLVPGQQSRGVVMRELAEMLLAAQPPHPDRRAVHDLLGRARDVAGHERDQIGRHQLGRREAPGPGRAIRAFSYRVERAIRKHRRLCIGRDAVGEECLEDRLVEAGEDPAGVGRLALCRQHLLRPVGRQIQALEAAAQRPLEGELERRIADRERRGKANQCDLPLAVDLDAARARVAPGGEPRLRDLEVERVQLDQIARLGHLELNNNAALERLGPEARLDLHIVAPGQDICGQTVRFRVHRGSFVHFGCFTSGGDNQEPLCHKRDA